MMIDEKYKQELKEMIEGKTKEEYYACKELINEVNANE